jgi:hypothetical protein
MKIGKYEIHPFALFFTGEVAVLYVLLALIFFEFDFYSARLFLLSIPLIAGIAGKTMNKLVMEEQTNAISN